MRPPSRRKPAGVKKECLCLELLPAVLAMICRKLSFTLFSLSNRRLSLLGRTSACPQETFFFFLRLILFAFFALLGKSVTYDFFLILNLPCPWRCRTIDRNAEPATVHFLLMWSDTGKGCVWTAGDESGRIGAIIEHMSKIAWYFIWRYSFRCSCRRFVSL